MLTAFSCNPLEEIAAAYEGDLQPPRVVGVRAVAAAKVIASFDEPLSEEDVTVLVDPVVPVRVAKARGTVLSIEFLTPLLAGRAYAVEAAVRDAASNTTTFVAKVHGLNDRVPEVVISEITPRGSGNHPDAVEIFCRTGGDLAGVTVMEGARSSGLDSYTFPGMEVEAGDYLIVHFRPEGIPEEIDETEDPAASGGLDAHPSAYDFWITGGDGLSGNNGAVTVYESPGGRLLDAVIYSNRTAESDQRYRGFGTRRVMEMVDEITADGGWRFSGDNAYPEDAVNPEGSTSTRSICRGSDMVDTNAASDWHIVPTRGATFGEANTDAEHQP